MPITIKKPPFKPCDRTYRKWTAVSMIGAVLLTAALTVFVRTVIRNNDAGAVVTCLTEAAYLMFLTSCVGAACTGIKTYVKEDNGTVLLQSLVYVLTVIFCLLNFRFLLASTLSALGAKNAADKLIGSQSYADFIAGNYAYWVCLGIGIFAAFLLGIFGTSKLISNRSKKG